MHKCISRAGFVLALGVLGGTLSGCVAAAVGVGAAATYGAVKYTGNEHYRDYPADLESTWQATLRMLNRIGHEIPMSTSCAATKGYLEFDEKSAKIWVDAQSPTWTRVTVRLGTFDSTVARQRSKAMLDSIDERLRDMAFERNMGRHPRPMPPATSPKKAGPKEIAPKKPAL